MLSALLLPVPVQAELRAALANVIDELDSVRLGWGCQRQSETLICRD